MIAGNIFSFLMNRHVELKLKSSFENVNIIMKRETDIRSMSHLKFQRR